MCKMIRYDVDVELEGKAYQDCGVLLLPKDYTEDGKATRLVIFCHGAGGSIEVNDSQTETQVLTQYLVANGFAVADVNGLPHAYAKEKGIDIRNNIGSPGAVDCYVNAYHTLMKRYHFKREIYVMGGSMGGISSTNLVFSERIPVIAHAAFCPVLDTREIFLHPWTEGLPKIAMGIYYDFQKDPNGEYIYDEEKIGRFNPAEYIKKKSYPVPVKFWHCADDPIVSVDATRRFIDHVQDRGGEAELVVLPSGGHEPSEYGDPILHPSGCTEYHHEHLEIKPVVEEAFRWFMKFEAK